VLCIASTTPTGSAKTPHCVADELFYTRFYQLEDVRKMMAENLAEEEGFKALPQPGHEPHDHVELILATVPSVVCQAGRQRLTCFSNYHSAPHDRSRVDLGRFLRV